MKFSVAKCHLMRLTRHLPDKHIYFDYSLHQQRFEQVQSTKYPDITITNNLDWYNTFQKFHLRQLRQWNFFDTIWLRHLSTLGMLHTKHWFAFSSIMQPLFGTPITNLRLDRWISCRGQTPGGPARDEECWTNLNGHTWRPAGSSPP